MKYKPGALVMLLKANSRMCAPLIGTFQTLLERDTYPKYWILDGVRVGGYDNVAWHEDDMKLIDPGEGNESWFKSAPLERAKPAEVEA